MRIIAIDPGLERVGIAILDKERGGKETLVFSECFKTKSSLTLSERLNLIGVHLNEIILEYKPEALAIESLFFTTNQKTAMVVSQARGVIIYEGAKNNLPIYEYTPLQIKVAVTGYGKATKTQVDSMVQKLIIISKKIKSDDEMDAVAIGLTCFACIRS
ncbi:MAG: crossover junction endodeoxyribonuclease ruvC [Parcubacteria group bacterium LiPW_30]|nr:MAG: crossover junction endodeoxyribonuclease ruvC [Parcubacteria group bacterium LiPW_30]